MIATASGWCSRCASANSRRQDLVQVAAVEQARELVARGLLVQRRCSACTSADLARQLRVGRLELGVRASRWRAAARLLGELVLQPQQLGLQRGRLVARARGQCARAPRAAAARGAACANACAASPAARAPRRRAVVHAVHAQTQALGAVGVVGADQRQRLIQRRRASGPDRPAPARASRRRSPARRVRRGSARARCARRASTSSRPTLRSPARNAAIASVS